MALKPCRECGREVSPNASICPYCGVVGPGRRFLRPFIVFVILGALAILALASCAPTEAEREQLRVDYIVAQYGVMAMERRVDSVMARWAASGLPHDSLLARLRPIEDSVAAAHRRFEEARYQLERAGVPEP